MTVRFGVQVGSGTDPGEGAALAGALLDKLADTAGLTYATTHHAQLKDRPVSTQHCFSSSVCLTVRRCKWLQARKEEILTASKEFAFCAACLPATSVLFSLLSRCTQNSRQAEGQGVAHSTLTWTGSARQNNASTTIALTLSTATCIKL